MADRPDARAERRALIELITAHRAMIEAYAHAIVRDAELVDEVFQETALVLAEEWESVPHGEALVPWLKAVVRRRALAALRRYRPQRATLDAATLELLADAFEPDEPPLPRQRLGECLARLRGDARTVIEARYWRGLGCEQIAREIGRSVAAVYQILTRSRSALQRCLEARDG